MKRTALLSIGLLLPLAACRSLPTTVGQANGISLKPVAVSKPVHRQAGMREGQDLSRLAFHITTPWSDGPIELRFPEVLRSSAGFHFLDNYAADITPTCEWPEFPQWQTDAATGRLYYDFKTPDGLRLTGSALPAGDEVRLEFTVANETTNAIDGVEANCCLAFNDARQLNEKWNLDRLYAVVAGEWQPLAKLTPTPREMGRKPWLLLMREDAAKTTVLPRVSPTWWRTDQHHTENLMAAVTRDGRHLVGYTWSVEPVGLMSNCGNPCLHTGMGASPPIPPGHSFTWHGKIYLLPNKPAELLHRYRADQAEWKKTPGTVNQPFAHAK